MSQRLVNTRSAALACATLMTLATLGFVDGLARHEAALAELAAAPAAPAAALAAPVAATSSTGTAPRG